MTPKVKMCKNSTNDSDDETHTNTRCMHSLALRGVLRVVVVGVMIFLIFTQIVSREHAVIASPVSEKLWGISQECSFEIKKANKSLDGSTQGFDGKTASCERDAGIQDIAWIFTQFENVDLQIIHSVQLEIRLYLSEWKSDNILFLQVSANNGMDWITIEEFSAANPAPAELKLNTYDLGYLLNTPDSLEHAQIQLFSPGHADSESELKIHIDGVALMITGEALPTATPEITEPILPTATSTPGATFLPTSTILPQATSTATLDPLAITIENTSTEILPTGTITVTPYPVVSPTMVITSTPAVTFTAAPSETLTSTMPSATTTPLPRTVLDIGSPNEIQTLWGIEQFCDYNIGSAGNSLDLSFNDQTALCEGEFAREESNWQIIAFQHTTFTHINDVILEVRFAFSGLVDDQINLEVYDGNQWRLLEQFGGTQSSPPESLGTLSYPLGGYLTSPEALNVASVRFIGITSNNQVDFVRIELDEIRLLVAGGFPASQPLSALPTPSFSLMALADAPAASDPHGDHGLLTDSCAACHRSHSSLGYILRQSAMEESVCFSCHSNTGPGTDVLPAFVSHVNTPTRYFTHDVARTSSVHQVNESNSGGFGGGNRHVECEDCHDPHNAARGTSSAPMLPFEMTGVTGVDPSWSGPGAPVSYTWLSDATREYQVCFKCHSGFTTLPSYNPDGWNGSAYVASGLRKLSSSNQQQVRDSRDLAREFNPNQASFHPVVTQGRNQTMQSGSFVNGWSQNSMTYCTDCHSNPNAAAEGLGPHGSPMLHFLNATANYSTVYTNGSPRVSRSEICFQCHNYDTYVLGENNFTKFRDHKKHMDNDWGTTCYTCHDTHGSEQLHLINFDASAMTFLNGRNSQTAWYYDQVSGRAGCFLSCHNKNHDPEQYTP